MTAIAGTTFIYPFFPTFNSLISQKPKLTKTNYKRINRDERIIQTNEKRRRKKRISETNYLSILFIQPNIPLVFH
jgi:hypothetical protein